MGQLRDIIEIDEELCTGCGLCVPACAEGALQIVDGKARLVGELYCDGLGACLGECPEGALTVVKRDAAAFDEKAVEERLAKLEDAPPRENEPLSNLLKEFDAKPCGCPSSQQMQFEPAAGPAPAEAGQASGLGHWPIKLGLLGPQAPFLKNADLLLLADCAAAAYPDLHSRLLPGKAVALACPKLDDPQAHIERLAQILVGARPKSVSVAIMEVPCCRGLEFIAQKALQAAGMDMPVGRVVIGRQGQVLEEAA